jgi:hypothetical protein
VCKKTGQIHLFFRLRLSLSTGDQIAHLGCLLEDQNYKNWANSLQKLGKFTTKTGKILGKIGKS